MKATLTCEKIAPGKSRFTVEAEVSEDLLDYEGVVIADSDIDFLVPEPEDDPKKLTRICVLHHSTEVGVMAQPSKGIASFHFKYQTAAGSFEIGAACPIE